jgi:hypothetical protein
MKSDDKWLLFKNYLHNELGITKEDIRMWVVEAVKEEAKRLVDNEFNSFNVHSVIKNILTGDKYNSTGWGKLREDISNTISKDIINSLEISIKPKNVI